MPAGYSGQPLHRKLGLEPGLRAAVLNAPPSYWELLEEIPARVRFHKRIVPGLDFVHLFVTATAELDRRLDQLRAAIRPQGMIWISWPKKASRRATDLTEDVVRRLALMHGLVDVKVCAVDDVWSGLKLVIPVKDRPLADRSAARRSR
ncbi:MAG: DUF3052 domain-containing protein [Gemmatimonadetes bacterium]|nr:DUF3052 domain-containing protein [Gemmatimonadota bacterium]